MPHHYRFLVALTSVVMTGHVFATSPEDVPSTSPGASKETAIEVCMPAGEQTYLSRLVCPSGKAPLYTRVGSLGPRYKREAGDQRAQLSFEELINGAPLKPNQLDEHILDGFEVKCDNKTYFLHVDMYHCGQAPTNLAPAGFTLR